jgi:nicotinate-nucleotide adenylyltransferase
VGEASARTIAFFGGSFDPPHVGHVLAAVYVRSAFAIEEVVVVPVFQHPFAKTLTPYDIRLELCRAAFGWLPSVTVSDLEQRLGGESLTLRTLEALRDERPDAALRLVIGSDVVADLPKWHRFDLIEKIAPPLVLPRAGVESTVEPILPKISSSQVRRAIAAGEVDRIAPLVPRAVLEGIEAAGLYSA